MMMAIQTRPPTLSLCSTCHLNATRKTEQSGLPPLAQPPLASLSLPFMRHYRIRQVVKWGIVHFFLLWCTVSIILSTTDGSDSCMPSVSKEPSHPSHAYI